MVTITAWLTRTTRSFFFGTFVFLLELLLERSFPLNPQTPRSSQAGPQAAGQEYDGAKSKQAKKVAAQGQSSAYGVLDAFDDFLKFLDEEFWLIFFAIVYAFSLIFFLLAIVNVRKAPPRSLCRSEEPRRTRPHSPTNTQRSSYAVKKNEHHASTPPSLCGDWVRYIYTTAEKK